MCWVKVYSEGNISEVLFVDVLGDYILGIEIVSVLLVVGVWILLSVILMCVLLECRNVDVMRRNSINYVLICEL